MAKKGKFTSGDYVSGKKLNGEPFIGLYLYEYDCGDHCIDDGEKHYCVNKNDCHLASEEEENEIRKIFKKPKRTKKEQDLEETFEQE